MLDNLDDDHFLHEIPSIETNSPGSYETGAPRRSIWEYLPRNPSTGLILITSRSRHLVASIVEDSDIILVEPMDETHAITLFEKKFGMETNRKDTIELTAALEFMPLAIVQAAAYIKRRAPRLSVPHYLNQFRESDSQKIRLLDHEGGHLRRDREAKNTILVTWQISFDYIRGIRPSAADLLSLMSFFDRQGIPCILLRDSKETKQIMEKKNDGSDTESANGSSIVEMFEEDILVLRDYSLISIDANGKNFEMHRLVQLAMQEWLKAHEKHEMWKKRFIRNLTSEFPVGDREDWPRCELLFPHVKSAMSQRPNKSSEDSILEWALLLHKGSQYTRRNGNWIDMESMAKNVMEVCNLLFGPEDIKTLNSIAMLGLAYTLQGRWQDAKMLHTEVIETSRRVLGPEHPRTLNSMANLASTHRNQGQWKDAEALDLQVLETHERVLGMEHPWTLIAMSNLATTYWNQGQWKDAEALNLHVLKTRQNAFGKEHLDTLIGMAQLATTYQKQERWQDAEALEVQVLDIRKRILGPKHPDTLASMNNLASTYWNQGRWQDAEALLERVLEAHQGLPRNHPHALVSMGNLASTYLKQNRWEDAEALNENLLRIRKHVLGEEHPETLTTMGNLASTYWSQGRWEDAERLGVQVLEISKRVLGEEHPDTLTSKFNLASTYLKQGREQDAKALKVPVLRASTVMLREEHHNQRVVNLITDFGNLETNFQQTSCLDAPFSLSATLDKPLELGEEGVEGLYSLAFEDVGTRRISGKHVVGSPIRKEVVGSYHSSQELARRKPSRFRTFNVSTSQKMGNFTQWLREKAGYLASKAPSLFPGSGFKPRRHNFPEVPGEMFRNQKLVEIRHVYSGSAGPSHEHARLPSPTNSNESVASVGGVETNSGTTESDLRQP